MRFPAVFLCSSLSPPSSRIPAPIAHDLNQTSEAPIPSLPLLILIVLILCGRRPEACGENFNVASVCYGEYGAFASRRTSSIIMPRPKAPEIPCGNPLFLEWVKEWMDNAKARNSNGYHVWQRVQATQSPS
jgi:hypothetical protein